MGKREDICAVKGRTHGKGRTRGKGRHRYQSKGHVQLCNKLIELERMDKESKKRARVFFAWSTEDVR